MGDNAIKEYEFEPIQQNKEILNEEISQILEGTNKKEILNILNAEYKAYYKTKKYVGTKHDYTEDQENDIYNDYITTHLKGTNIELIGSGAFNYVYKFNDNFVLRLSKFRIDFVNDPNIESVKLNREFKTSIKQLNLINCENIPQIYSTGQIIPTHDKESGEHLIVRVYTIMENLSGDELYYYMEQKKKGYNKPTFHDTKIIIYKILKALECMYKTGHCHNDIKPENIMLKTKNDFNTVKLVDFGGISNCPDNTNKDLIGTPAYLHYNYLAYKGKSSKIDMWALGVICLELLIPGMFLQKDTEDAQEKKYQKYYKDIYHDKISTQEEYSDFKELLGLLLGIETISSKIEDVPLSKNVTHCLERMMNSTCRLYDNPYTILLGLPIFEKINNDPDGGDIPPKTGNGKKLTKRNRRKSTKRKSTKRKSTKRKSSKRKSSKRK